MMENRKCKNKCEITSEGYKHRYCENCRNVHIKRIKDTGRQHWVCSFSWRYCTHDSNKRKKQVLKSNDTTLRDVIAFNDKYTKLPWKVK